MHSKFKIWDFVKQNDFTISKADEGVVAIYSYEALFHQILSENIFKKFDRSEFKILNAKDLDSNWVQDNLKSLSLFGDTESYIIKSAEDLSEDLKEEFTQDLGLEGRHLILLFNKNDKFFQKISKAENIKTYSIVEHPFWEADKLLEFALGRYGIAISYDAKEYILEVVNNTYLDFINLCSKLELSFKDIEVSKEMLKTVITKNRVDNFEFARLFGYKRSKDFYEKLIDMSLTYDELRSLFYFLQTHMLKISSTDHIYKKPKQSKYDKQIIDQAKIWKPNELSLSISFLKNIEFRAKLKNPLVFNDLKSSLLKSSL